MKEISDTLNNLIPELTIAKTDELIKEAAPRLNIVLNMYPTPSTSIATSTTADLKYQLYLKMKLNLQDQAADPDMWEILKAKENDKPDSFSEADFKYLNKKDIEDMYYLCLNKKIRINLTAPTLIFSGIEECDPYSRVDKPTTGLIYLNIKEEKMVMYLVEIVKFCDATLERVLNEVKIKIFETGFLKKAPLLGELDLDIMKAYEREITKRLRHREQMRIWESFVNERPGIPMMRR
ncbi:hypothetical protein Tco_1500007 [Tanacetum coccineum]